MTQSHSFERLVLVNPCADNFYGIATFQVLTRRKSVEKYGFLIRSALKDGVKVAFYFDDKRLSLPLFFRSKWLHRWAQKADFYCWCIFNKVSPFRIEFIRDLTSLGARDVLFMTGYANHCSMINNIDLLRQCSAFKVLHLSHYMVSTQLLSEFTRQGNFDLFIAETNLGNSPFFRRYFSHIDQTYVLPFVYQERFIPKTMFRERLNKCLSIGTYANLEGAPSLDEFRDFFKTDTYHPIRKALFLAQNKYAEFIDTITQKHYEKKILYPKKGDWIVKKVLKKFYNVFFIKQSKYYSINIVDVFNRHKLFVCGEEWGHLPGISFVEGMASGCAYIGLKSTMYSDIGLQEGQHFVGYDGTLEDLCNKIQYYQTHSQELEAIATSGTQYVRRNFKGDVVFRKFWNDLEKIRANQDVAKNV